MTLDPSLIQLLFTGFGTISCALISWLLKRSIQHHDRALESHQDLIEASRDSIEEIRIDLAKNYVSKTDLEKQLEVQLRPLRADVQEVKEDIKTLIRRGKP